MYRLHSASQPNRAVPIRASHDAGLCFGLPTHHTAKAEEMEWSGQFPKIQLGFLPVLRAMPLRGSLLGLLHDPRFDSWNAVQIDNGHVRIGPCGEVHEDQGDVSMDGAIATIT